MRHGRSSPVGSKWTLQVHLTRVRGSSTACTLTGRDDGGTPIERDNERATLEGPIVIERSLSSHPDPAAPPTIRRSDRGTGPAASVSGPVTDPSARACGSSPQHVRVEEGRSTVEFHIRHTGDQLREHEPELHAGQVRSEAEVGTAAPEGLFPSRATELMRVGTPGGADPQGSDLATPRVHSQPSAMCSVSLTECPTMLNRAAALGAPTVRACVTGLPACSYVPVTRCRCEG
jgi:hypothetical protein